MSLGAARPVILQPTAADDRGRIARIRPPAGTAHFVHYNRFWLDRSLADPAIRMCLVRGGLRNALVGVVAFGPHEAVDGDPASRMNGVGEVYHLVIDRSRGRQGSAARPCWPPSAR